MLCREDPCPITVSVWSLYQEEAEAEAITVVEFQVPG